MQTLGSVASIIAAIREDAAAEVEHVEESMNAEVASIRAEEASTDVRIPDRDARLAAARRENDQSIAHQEWEGRRAAMAQRETWIESVTAKPREHWRGDAAQLNALIREALQKLDAHECEVAVAQRDRELVDAANLPAEKKIRLTTAPIAGGCIITAGDVVFDNSFEARTRRLEPEWRKALSELYRVDVGPHVDQAAGPKEAP
jgi:vacuolar-type H+-ATPase subunit E/Vma4